MRPVVFTIGHSTRPLDAFIALLRANAITRLADVRTVPKSRRHPQFGGDALAAALSAEGIVYRHFPGLGGLRKPRPDSPNATWRHEGFRGYADYMETPAFAEAVDRLVAFALVAPTAIMCAEAVWWRCHRQLIADALVARGIDVRHITSAAAPARHTLTKFARIVDGTVSYRGLLE